MDIAAVRDLVLETNLCLYGVPATVTIPAGAPVDTQVIWSEPPLKEPAPFGADLRRLDPRRVLNIPRLDTLPDVPKGSAILAPERVGGIVLAWRADGLDRESTPSLNYVIVVPA